jgi:uncharacterized protein YceH (UPF0502 family)/SAM-dependent methyltransferase
VSERSELDAVEQRVLGCLLEKQVTVPAGYPLTLNALRTACNQTSSREPVMDLDDRTVETTARALRDRGLVRVVWADTGRRTLKYLHTLPEVLPLDDAERALVTVLLLRGGQTPGELKARTERLHPFPDKDAIELCLRGLADRTEPVVRQVERRAGQQDHRWVHLLGPLPEVPARQSAETVAAVDYEAPLADGGAARDERVRRGYGTVAADYAEQLIGELDDLPFERWLLDRVVQAAGGQPVVDAGCGPGHVTAYLAAAGVDICGIDLTPQMVEQARSRFPEVPYEVGDLTRLMRPPTAPGWGAVIGWYSLIHLAGSELPAAIAALVRPLVPGGVLLLGMHAGREVRRMTTWFDHDVALDFVSHEPDEVVAAVAAAGLIDVEWYRRGPVQGRGETTERLYLLAHRPTPGVCGV